VARSAVQRCRLCLGCHAVGAACVLQEVGNVAAFLVSPLASAVTGHVMYVDNGLNIMGLASDSKTLLERDSA
jgi:enoyl-[acyl-carrier-protein] reductase (NADH)